MFKNKVIIVTGKPFLHVVVLRILDAFSYDPYEASKKLLSISGSSTGIGAGTAIKFAELGAAAVTIHGRQEAALKSVKEKVEKAGQGQTKVRLCL